MSRKDAESLTGLDTRENPNAHNDYLRCCLGSYESVMVQTSAFRSIPQTVFRLIAFGSSWDNAVSMWEKMQKKESMKSFAL